MQTWPTKVIMIMKGKVFPENGCCNICVKCSHVVYCYMTLDVEWYKHSYVVIHLKNIIE